MSAHEGQNGPETSGRRTLFNILGFMFGTIVVLLLLKYLLGM